jgi:CheY-like chemotaxis protein
VARVLIYEPNEDTGALLDLVVRRLGHEPVRLEAAAAGEAVQAAVIEPGEHGGLELARRLRAEGVPVLFASIFPASRETLELEPSAYLEKPFALAAFERALAEALIASPVA